MKENFEEFFKKATGMKPYPYQHKLSEAVEFPSLIDIPTGLGKTAAVVIGWLWRRRFHSNEKIRDNTPRRLVYCLPMRVLVEQTRDNVIIWLNNLGLLGGTVKFDEKEGKRKVIEYQPSWEDPDKITVTVLMGGETGDKWDIYPERDAIIIGTQDMLLSRALNRGYGMSRYRWPIHFGLLNNDSCWIMDEVQLMGNGLITSIQMEAFREYYKTAKKTHTVWMSATITPSWLKSVDFKREFRDEDILRCTDADLTNDNIKKILKGSKTLKLISEDELLKTVIDNHIGGTKTLIILNTVARAKKIYEQLKNKNIGSRVVLIHSQFRPPERQKIIKQILADPEKEGTIIVSTQVIEAGVDISAHTLITELAPFPSLVQRFGRCNRFGEYTDGKVFWIDILNTSKKEDVLPYTEKELSISKKILEQLNQQNVSPDNLPKLTSESFMQDREIIRRKDIFELFDTTSDITGENIDISKFIRDRKDTNVQVFWRDLVKDGPTEYEPLQERDELCPVPILDVKKLVDKKTDLWSWDYFEGVWVRVSDSTKIFPGQVLLLKSTEGHYSIEEGWDIKKKEKVPIIKIDKSISGERYDDNSSLQIKTNEWMNIAQHTDEVVAKAISICNNISLLSKLSDSVIEAARWHDSGKSHLCFQAMLDSTAVPNEEFRPVAKAPREAWVSNNENMRKHFRHELASGLLAILNNKSDLTAYLAASHHGKVRLSIRSMPDEDMPPGDKKIRFARGVWDGDIVPLTDLGGGVTVPLTTIDLSLMELGDGIHGPSWLSRTLSMCEDPELGIFKLGYLEALVRAADERASGGL